MSLPEFQAANKAFIEQYVAVRQPDPHEQTLLAEILAEQAMGRIEGPFSSPSSWPAKAIAVANLSLLPLPEQEPFFAAPAFSIVQLNADGSEKIRRGEDWRRSLHNRTIQVTDKPVHHTVDSFIACAAHLRLPAGPNAVDSSVAASARHGTHTGRAVLWGHDHDGAYRQLPVRDPCHTYMVLLTPQGPTIWRHNVLLFGAAASVWGYNRFGDVLRFIARALLASPVLHYVDDYGSSEPWPQDDIHMQSCTSAFQSFADLNSLLGFNMKPSKAQPPSTHHRVQGVHLRLMEDRAIVSPVQARVTKVIQSIDTALATNVLKPPVAARMAGKCSYLSTTTYGRVGRAATKPVYARQHCEHRRHQKHYRLTHALKAALLTIRQMLLTSKPRIVFYRPRCHSRAVIYADAFFLMGDRTFKPSDPDIPES